VRLVSVSGTRGSGKTTLIGGLVDRLTAAGKSCAVVVNESGTVAYQDFPLVAAGKLPVSYLRGG
jgi:molybdopterin-guanine dinucleotide biosynthesis protein